VGSAHNREKELVAGGRRDFQYFLITRLDSSCTGKGSWRRSGKRKRRFVKERAVGVITIPAYTGEEPL